MKKAQKSKQRSTNWRRRHLGHMQQQPRRCPGFDECVETKLRWDVCIRPWPPGWSFWRRIYTSRGSERVKINGHTGKSQLRKRKSLKICHVNARSLLASGRLLDLEILCSTNDIDVLCVTETWLNPDRVKEGASLIHIPGYSPPLRATASVDGEEELQSSCVTD